MMRSRPRRVCVHFDEGLDPNRCPTRQGHSKDGASHSNILWRCSRKIGIPPPDLVMEFGRFTRQRRALYEAFLPCASLDERKTAMHRPFHVCRCYPALDSIGVWRCRSTHCAANMTLTLDGLRQLKEISIVKSATSKKSRIWPSTHRHLHVDKLVRHGWGSERHFLKLGMPCG